MQETISKQEEKKKKEKPKGKTIEDNEQKKTSEVIKREKSLDDLNEEDSNELLQKPSIHTEDQIPISSKDQLSRITIDEEETVDKYTIVPESPITVDEPIEEETKKEIVIPSIQEIYERRKELHDLSFPILDYTDSDLSTKSLLNSVIPEIKQKERKKLRVIYFKVSPYPKLRIKEHLDKQYSNRIVKGLSKRSLYTERKTDLEFLDEAKLGEEQKEIIEYDVIEEGGVGFGEDNIFTELFERDIEPKEWDRFQSSINSKEPLCIFLIAKDDKFIAEKTIVKLLSAEYKRKYGKIDASHELEDLSDSDISIITFAPEQVDNFIEALKIRKSNIHHSEKQSKEDEYKKFVKLLDDLMQQIDFTRGGEKKLVIFKCSSRSDVEGLYNEVKKNITTTYKLRPKYSSLSENSLKKIVEQLCWLHSIPSYKPQFIIDDDLDSIFTGLDKERRYYYDKLTMDNDWFKIIKSWSDEDPEHLKLKLLVYKRLKKLGFKDSEIEIEERFSMEGKERLIPDLYVRGKVWVEIETLLGSAGPSYLIQEKIHNRRNGIMQHNEFWLVLPNFEIFMHKKEVNSLFTQLYNLFNRQVKVTIFGCDFKKTDLCLYKSKGRE